MDTRRRDRSGERGSTFVVVTLLIITSTAIVGAYLSTSLGKVRHVENQASRTAAFYAAEAGLNAGLEEVWNRYRSAPPSTRLEFVANMDGSVDEADRFSESFRMGDFDVTVVAQAANLVPKEYVDVELVARAARDDASRTLRAVIRFDVAQSRVFDHAYFINNFGWLWGSGIEVNGDVRSNGDFSLLSATVNGDIYAARNDGLLALGTITGTSSHDSIHTYTNSGAPDAQKRPTNPSAPSEDANGNGELDPGEDANDNGVLDTYEYPGGYDGDSERFPADAPVEMPYLGDLQIYRDMATNASGRITQDGVVLVDAVSGDSGNEDRNVVLIGTADHPIVIDGPVVVEGDVVIKGVITGRGTIYAGRNVHILGDLAYANPPEWPKPMEDREAIKTQNETRDQVGLVAKGSVVVGNYTNGTWRSNTAPYQRPPFTQSYVVDPTDDANGYVSSYDSEGRPVFDGNYTGYDGGRKNAPPPGSADGVTVDDGARRYYESSFADAYIDSIADKKEVEHVDAVIYTNHLLTGKIGQTVFNGALVSRDEAMIYKNHLTINHDVRIRGNGYEFMDIWLPREPSYRILFWCEEVAP